MLSDNKEASIFNLAEYKAHREKNRQKMKNHPEQPKAQLVIELQAHHRFSISATGINKYNAIDMLFALLRASLEVHTVIL